ncbi:MAG: penicillin-binding transpeptidase domain-containing protein [Filifactoraceae bacterium]
MARKKFVRYEATMAKRLNVMMFLMMIGVAAIIARLGYLQIINPDKYSDAAMEQQISDKIILPVRGTIYDRNGKELAVSVPVYDILIEKKNIKEEDRARFISSFVQILGVDEATMIEAFNSEKERFYGAKKVDVSKVEAIKALGFKGLSYEESSNRVYPYGKFAAHVLGHLSFDNRGLSGLEQYFEKQLRGTEGRMMVFKDAAGREVKDNAVRYNEPIQGGNLITTIDEVIQHFTEIAVGQALYETQGLKITAIVMNPKNGDIYAMSSYPDYDSNDPKTPQFEYWKEEINGAKTDVAKGEVISKMWRNPAINDVYEPGSPFKLVTAAAGLEEGVVSTEETFVDIGYRKVEDKTIKNWTNIPYGTITFRKAVEQSINTYFMDVAFRLGKERLLKYINIFGFGKITGIALPGEAQGILYPLEKVGPVELATISFGQGVTATPIQMITAISAFGNEGIMMKPRIVKEIVDNDGNIIKRFEPEIVKRTVSTETAREVLGLMESVVDGTGTSRIEGYRVGGKSGTAQKVINGAYKDGYYISTFAAIAPIDDPQLSVIVIVDEPKGVTYGAAVAGPVVQSILKDSLRYLGISPTEKVSTHTDIKKVNIPEIRNMTYDSAIAMLNVNSLNGSTNYKGEGLASSVVIDTYPKPGEKVPVGSSVILYFKEEKKEESVMPDLRGKTLEEIEKILKDMGLQYKVNGKGIVVGQYPEPGSILGKGAMTSFDLMESKVTVVTGN